MKKYYNPHQTERIAIRPVDRNDVKPWTEFFENLPHAEWIAIPQMDDAVHHSNIWIKRQLGRYRRQEYGLLGLTLPHNRELIGMAGLMTQTVDNQPELEIGYHLLPKYWGQGYATEAAQYFKGWAFEHQLAPSVISIIHEDNLPSRQVALRNGMVFEKAITFKDTPCHLYRAFSPGT